MPADWTVYFCLALALASALVGGVFQTFSDFVMRALVAAQSAVGVEAMQSINRTVYRSVFLVLLLGLTPLMIVFALYAQGAISGAARSWITVGALLYATSVFLVTLFSNVPMNKRLDKMTAAARETEAYWQSYSSVWTRWNHVRTFGCIACSICFFFAAVTLA